MDNLPNETAELFPINDEIEIIYYENNQHTPNIDPDIIYISSDSDEDCVDKDLVNNEIKTNVQTGNKNKTILRLRPISSLMESKNGAAEGHGVSPTGQTADASAKEYVKKLGVGGLAKLGYDMGSSKTSNGKAEMVKSTTIGNRLHLPTEDVEVAPTIES